MRKSNSIVAILLAACMLSGCGMHTHVYENECDERCDICGAERSIYGHRYSGECDSTCNACGEEREAKEHTYSTDCDTVCDCCGWERVSSVSHAHEDTCAWYCDLCGAELSDGGHNFSKNYTYNNDATHSSNGTESKTCSKCGFVWETRAVENTAGHSFNSKKECTECGFAIPNFEDYLIYESFEGRQKYGVSYGGSGYLSKGTVKLGDFKSGVLCNVATRVSEDDTDLRCLEMFRAESDNTSGNDGLVDLVATWDTDIRHTLEFDISVGVGNATNIYVNGRKEPEGAGNIQFNSFVWYKASDRRLYAGSTAIAENFNDGKWHNIAITVDDNAGCYDVYLDGVRVANGVRYTNENYPSAAQQRVDLYRITMLKGTSMAAFYLDNLTVYYGEYRGI